MPTSPVTYPLGPPVVSNTTVTVDLALKQPGRITKRLSDITKRRFIAPELFVPSGASTAAGVIIYDTLTINDLFMSKDVEQRGPTDEYPVVSSQRQQPSVAKSEDWGGKFPVSDEAVKRNDSMYMTIETQKLANTIVRKVNERTVAVLDAVITSLGGAGVVVGNDWSNVTLTGTSPTPNNQRPFADMIAAQLAADIEELGYEYNVWIMNPQEDANLKIAYGPDYAAILQSAGVSTFVSNRVTAGTAYAAVRGGVGFLDYEEQLQTETWREPKNRTSWVQSFVKPIMGVTDPYAVKKVTGLAG